MSSSIVEDLENKEKQEQSIFTNKMNLQTPPNQSVTSQQFRNYKDFFLQPEEQETDIEVD